MPANVGRETVTMRHPEIENELVCFDFQVDHHKSLGWKVATEAPEKPAKPKAKPAEAPTTNDTPPEEG